MTRDAGVTLLELLVALVVLGFVMVGLGQGTRFGLMAWDRQNRILDEHADLDAVDRVLRGLIEHMVPGASIDAPNIVGNSTQLEFTSELPRGAVGLAMRNADMLLAVDAKHRLVLRWTPHINAARFGSAPPPIETPLLEGVDRLDLAYWPRIGAAWTAAWSDRAPPALLRIRLVFVRGDPRRWPDIVASPMLDSS